MRTRSKYDDTEIGDKGPFVTKTSSWNASGYWNPSSDGTMPIQGTVVLDWGTESIEDDVIPSRVTKPVTHRSEHHKRFPINSYVESTSSNRYEYSGPNAHWYSWGAYGLVGFNHVYTAYPKSINQLKAEAMHKFHASNEVDTLLNLCESPQLVASCRSLATERNRRLWEDVRRKMGFFAGKSRVERRLSSKYLFYSFGLGPLIDDMYSIYRAVGTLKESMDRHIKNYNRSYLTSSSCTGHFGTAITGTGYGSNASGGDATWWHAKVLPTFVPTLRVGVRGHRNVDYHSDSMKKLDYMIRRFMASGPVSLGWEITRFSFMVDWFVNLSGVIDSLDNAVTGNSRGIDDIWMSEKWSCMIPVYKHKHVAWISDSDGQQTGHNELSYYHREAIPSDPTIAMSGRFGKKQASLTAALIHQLVTNLRKAQ